MDRRFALRPISARTVWILLAAAVTALPSWWIPGVHGLSLGLHTALGLSIAIYGVWGCWRPVAVLEDGVLVHGPRLHADRQRLPLADVERVLPDVHTGHAPSERDLRARLCVRTRDGGFQWVDLWDLRAGDRERLRTLLREAAAASRRPR